MSQASPNSEFRNKTKGIAIKYVMQGQEEYLVHDHRIKVSSNQFIVLRTGENYQAFTNQVDKHTIGICVDLNPTSIVAEMPEFQSLDLLFGLPFQCQYFSQLGQLFNQLAIDENRGGEGKNYEKRIVQIKKELGQFAHTIQTLQWALSTKAKKVETQKALLFKLFVAKNFIHQQYTTTIKLSFLSRHVGLSPYYLIRLFRLCFHRSPQELQRDLRMQTALELLKTVDSSLSSIAYDLGFHDLAAFSNQFKRFYQQSPSAIKKLDK